MLGLKQLSVTPPFSAANPIRSHTSCASNPARRSPPASIGGRRISRGFPQSAASAFDPGRRAGATAADCTSGAEGLTHSGAGNPSQDGRNVPGVHGASSRFHTSRTGLLASRRAFWRRLETPPGFAQTVFLVFATVPVSYRNCRSRRNSPQCEGRHGRAVSQTLDCGRQNSPKGRKLPCATLAAMSESGPRRSSRRCHKR